MCQVFLNAWVYVKQKINLIGVRVTLAQVVSACSFSRSFTASSIVAMIFLLGSVFEVIEKLRPFTERFVSIWVNYLENINNTFLFICYISGVLCYFILADQFINVHKCLFFC